MKLGLPYQGSKNKIAFDLLSFIPPAKHFYDLFAGGCSMTHAAILSGKYSYFVVNDITDSTKLFVDAISGKYRSENRWISRDDFLLLKDSDTYVRICWSFGNNQKQYLYGKDIEPYKKAFHYAYFFCDGSLFSLLGVDLMGVEKLAPSYDKYLRLKRVIRDTKGRIDLQSLQSLESLERLQSLQSLQSLESLERLERLEGSYEKVDIKPNSVVYCDIPYRCTRGYLNDFDHDRYYDWVRDSKHIIFTSEYNMPNDFIPIKKIAVKSSFSSTSNNTKAIECLFVHKSKVDKIYKPELF